MLKLIESIKSGEIEKAGPALKIFLEQYGSTFNFPELNESNIREKLWEALAGYIKNPACTDLHADCFSMMRVLSRDKTNLNEVMNEELLSNVIQYAGINKEIDYANNMNYLTAVQALKALCNLIFNSTVAAAISCKNGCIEGITGRLHLFRDSKIPHEITFFDVKILFLITALCSEMREKLRVELGAVKYLIENLEVILKESTACADNADNRIIKLSSDNVDLSCEILKLLFNLTLKNDDSAADGDEELYKQLARILHDLLVGEVEQEKKRTELTNHVINLFTNMPKSTLSGLYGPITEGCELAEDASFMEYDMSAVKEMLEFLKRQLTQETAISSQTECLSPVLNTLLKLALSERPIRKYLKQQILPPLRDVHNRPEQGTTIRNYMCRLLTSPATHVSTLDAELLFVLCKENVNRMTKYTGYGNAAGLFGTRGLLGGNKDKNGSAYSSESEDSDTEEYKQYKHGINPIAGCYEPPRPSPTAHMTEEQKEYEAMKLVQLMDNLTRIGTVKPCRIGEDGKPEPVEHVLQLQEGLQNQQTHLNSDSD